MKFHYYLLLCLLLSYSCGEEEIIPTEASLLVFSDQEFNVLNEQLNVDQTISLQTTPIPDHLQEVAQSTAIEFDEATQVEALLGRLLFFDSRLSTNGGFSCASCHKPELAFGDDRPLSLSLQGAQTYRNTIALASIPTYVTIAGQEELPSNIFRQTYFRDLRSGSMRLAIEDKLRLTEYYTGNDLETLLSDVRQDEVYQPLVNRVLEINENESFGPAELTAALAAFCNTITSMNTPIDEYLSLEAQGNTSAELAVAFGEEVVNGAAIFNARCADCHGSDFAKSLLPASVNGLAIELEDRGMGRILRQPALNGFFSIPTLRNIELTAPYMHDGRIATLREVINHYSEGIQAHPQLGSQLRDQNTRGPLRMNFSEAEKDALIAYLKLATDETLTEREYLRDPWRE